MAILIKRYANRKLYNTETSRYITLKGIAKLLDEGEEVRVIDKETGEGWKPSTVAQVAGRMSKDSSCYRYSVRSNSAKNGCYIICSTKSDV